MPQPHDSLMLLEHQVRAELRALERERRLAWWMAGILAAGWAATLIVLLWVAAEA